MHVFVYMLLYMDVYAYMCTNVYILSSKLIFFIYSFPFHYIIFPFLQITECMLLIMYKGEVSISYSLPPLKL